MKNISKIFATFLALGLMSSCVQEGFEPADRNEAEVGAFGDFLKLRLNVVAPDPLTVSTKAVDPDGTGVLSMTFFCFDEEGLFISTADAALTTAGVEKGTIAEVTIPYKTRVIHVVCNHYMDYISVDAFEGMSETEVLGSMESISGVLGYWARVEIPADVQQLYTEVPEAGKRSYGEAVVDWLTIETNPASETHKGVAGKDNPIILLRNQAKVTVSSEGASDEKGWEGESFVVTGYAVYNSQATGTLAPLHTEKGWPTYYSSDFDVYDWVDESYVSVPSGSDVLNEVGDVYTFAESYIFESENSASNPVEVIVKGYNIANGVQENELYYKVDIMDADDGLVPIRRNHHYKLNIAGNLYNGSATFAEAIDAPATNNIWLSIADEVTEISDGNVVLGVEKHVVAVNIEDYQSKPLVLNFSVKAYGREDIDAGKISVEWEDGQNVSASDVCNVAFNAQTGAGTVTVDLNTPAQGQVLSGTVVVRYGHLQRKIKVSVLAKMDFTPVWTSTEVTTVEDASEDVTVMFHIPENYPQELFPFNVLVSTNDLSSRASSGQKLTVVLKGESGYGESFQETVDGKTVTDCGFKYVLNVTKPGVQRLYLQSLDKEVLNTTFYVALESENFNRYIVPVHIDNTDFKDYISIANASTYFPAGATEGGVKYLLVPAKKNAEVRIDLKALKPTADGPVSRPVGADDRFVLYSENLSAAANTAVTFDAAQNDPVAGRYLGFSPVAAMDNGELPIVMKTDRAVSAEVLGIMAADNSLRSVSLELANYRGFRFAAQINGEGTYKDGQEEEDEGMVQIGLQPGEDVTVSFDVTSFKVGETEVDPFGSSFKVYIDAPMLELGDNSALGNKVEDLGDGRFAYIVEADRAAEAAFGSGPALSSGVPGERKTINFKTKSVGSAGEITISADPEEIVYFTKTYKVSDSPVSGVVTVADAPLPAGHSMSFYYKKDGSRIATLTVLDGGRYDLYLSQERAPYWTGESVIVIAQLGGKYYSAEIADLESLFNRPDIALALAE